MDVSLNPFNTCHIGSCLKKIEEKKLCKLLLKDHVNKLDLLVVMVSLLGFHN